LKAKILLYDLETEPNLSYTWGKWEQNVIAFEKEGGLLSFSAKWLGGKQITKGLCDYKYKGNKLDDRELTKELHSLISEADVVIAHNGDRFDIKKMNTRFIFHKLSPPEPYKTIDTLKIARNKFAFNSNKLDDLGQFLGVGRKVKHQGFDLWLGCMNGDKKAWATMKRYNKQDVILLENIYKELLPWITNHPNLNVLQATTGCPNCSSDRLQKRGIGFTNKIKIQRYQCMNCGAWTQGKYAHT